jgi:two-component system, OmpR family, phosphate regulon sensor histidine kinase PhoR
VSPIAQQRAVALEFTGDESASLMTDPRAMNLIVKNLVENSLKYTPSGGRVKVAAGQADGTFTITVEDTGIGIPPEHLERVFERFYQVDAARTGGGTRGTGLGLAIVKHAVTALGGTVNLESKAGEGTIARCAFSTQ